jgi:hypothetical protein
VLRNNEIGIPDQRILHAPEGAETTESHRSKKLDRAVQNEAIHIGRARGYTLDEIDHLATGDDRPRQRGRLAAFLKPAYLGNGRTPVIWAFRER